MWMRGAWLAGLGGLVCLCVPALGEVEQAHFHHVHIRATDPGASIEFYRRHWNGVAVKYRGNVDAVLVDRSFLFFTRVDEAPPWELVSSIYHIGWGGIDGPGEYEWRRRAGMDFETPVTALGNNYYMYIFGPDRELIEVWTGFHHTRFGHVHLVADDVNVTARWYMEHLGLAGPPSDRPRPGPAPEGERGRIWSSFVVTGGVTINIFEKPHSGADWWWNYPPLEELAPTRGRVIDHIAFSYREIEPVLARMEAAGVEIVEGIAVREPYGFRSFFVEGPDRVLVEIVEEKPLPEGIWD